MARALASKWRKGTIGLDAQMEQHMLKLLEVDPHLTDPETREWSSKGLIDLHCHDRAFTDHDVYFEHEGGIAQFRDVPLWMKQDAVGTIHRGLAFTRASLRDRLGKVIKKKVRAGEKEVWIICDTSPDIGDRSFAVAKELKREYAGKIAVKVGVYPIFGFKSRTSPEGKARIGLVSDLAHEADFIVGLPERDARPDHAEIGFLGHLAILIDLAAKHDIPLQVHLDQSGSPEEDGAERFIEAVRHFAEARGILKKIPRIIAVHDISSAAYSEPRFLKLVGGHREFEIELCACIHAAISMRPLRQYAAPLHNIVARVLEMRLAGVPVALGTDNINDIFMPRPVSPLLARELDAFASALRFYDESVIYKIARGEPFNNSDYAALKRNLDQNFAAWGMPQGAEAYLAMNPAFHG